MCQEENVVAIATLTPEYGKIDYGGRLDLDPHLVNALNGSRIDNFTIGSYIGKLIFNNNKGYLYPREQCVSSIGP